ncbi:MAG TPA: metalloregulator ArsR/SmtB family transcription factor [Alphaproteobacteria bacterium]|nr:metalloregulator ArsR/SmtB family transcription factor [Alphaproteobacteria bacterium]
MEKIAALAALAGLAHETRLDIFRLLVEAGPAGLPAGALGESLGLAPATLSFHLSHMRHAGLVDCRRDGRSLIYAADFACMSALVAYLTENCCQGRPEVCAPAARTPAQPTLKSRGASHEAPTRARRR